MLTYLAEQETFLSPWRAVFWVECGKHWVLWKSPQINKPWEKLVLIKPKEKLFKLKMHRRSPNSWLGDNSKNVISPETNTLCSGYLTFVFITFLVQIFFKWKWVLKATTYPTSPPPQMSKLQDLFFSRRQNISFSVCHSLTVLLLGNSIFQQIYYLLKKILLSPTLRAFTSTHCDIGGGEVKGGFKWIGDTICYKIYPMIHGLFYKRWIKTDLDYYKWHWSKILECSGPTDEEDKQHAFQKHRNLHRLVQEGTPWNSIYCFLICSLNSLSFMTFISNPTNYINQYSLTRPAQRAVWRSCWRCALCGCSIESHVHKVKLVDVSVKKECVM